MLLSSVLEATKQRHRSWSEVTGAAGYVSCATCGHFAGSNLKNPLDLMHVLEFMRMAYD